MSKNNLQPIANIQRRVRIRRPEQGEALVPSEVQESWYRAGYKAGVAEKQQESYELGKKEAEDASNDSLRPVVNLGSGSSLQEGEVSIRYRYEFFLDNDQRHRLYTLNSRIHRIITYRQHTADNGVAPSRAVVQDYNVRGPEEAFIDNALSEVVISMVQGVLSFTDAEAFTTSLLRFLTTNTTLCSQAQSEHIYREVADYFGFQEINR